LLERKRLLDLLGSTPKGSVIALIAPAGYGKTVLLAQWVASTPRPKAWLTGHSSDSDPVGLLNRLWAAFDHAGMLVPDAKGRSDPSSPATDGVRRLALALRPGTDMGILVIDNLDALRSTASWDVIDAMIRVLRGQVQVVLASRSEPRLPFGEIRANGFLVEITESDLAFDEREAGRLFENVGVDGGPSLTQLMSRTEGWPVGVYLTALAMKSGATQDQLVQGDDLYLAEYIRDAILNRLSDTKRSFLIRTSILDRLSGPLCDAVLDTWGSQRVLEGLQRSNLLITRLDRTREWHRYHQMLRDLLQAELRLKEPEVVPELHARAAEWLEANGHPDLSIHHAQAAGDPSRVARLIERAGRVTYTTGRSSTLFEWLDWLEQNAESSSYPGAFALGALAASLSGDVLRGSRFIDRIRDESQHPLTLLVRALRARSGIEAMIADARAAQAGLPPGSEWLPGCIATEGLGWLFSGDVDQADSLFAQAIMLSGPLQATATATTAHTQRALIAMSARRWSDAEDHVTKALRLVLDNGLDGHSTSGLTFVAAARLARHQNDIPGAREMMVRASRLRPQLNISIPAESVQTGIEMTRAFVELWDVAAAKLIMRETKTILDQCPDLGVLGAQWEETNDKLSTLKPGEAGPTTLTAAELRLLPLLASHLTFPEIGERLYISRHTVKTQAMSIYRKLGASSRSEAVRVAEQVGLLGV
jgi:LuxR family maltose regulon positive regulatory protein